MTTVAAEPPIGTIAQAQTQAGVSTRIVRSLNGGIPRIVVWVLASQPVGVSLRQAVYATRG